MKGLSLNGRTICITRLVKDRTFLAPWDSPPIKTLTKNLVVIISVVPLQLVEVLWQRGGPAVRRHPAHALQGLVLHRGGVGNRAAEDQSINVNSKNRSTT